MLSCYRLCIHLPLQDAVDFVGTMCKAAIDRFVENKAVLPEFAYLDEVYPWSWYDGEESSAGSGLSGDSTTTATTTTNSLPLPQRKRRTPGSIDSDVRKYVQGLQDWIVGSKLTIADLSFIPYASFCLFLVFDIYICIPVGTSMCCISRCRRTLTSRRSILPPLRKHLHCS